MNVMGKRVEPKKTENIQVRIPVILFEEGDKIVAYSPAIDLSTCGDTEGQVRKRFSEAASIFFDEICLNSKPGCRQNTNPVLRK